MDDRWLDIEALAAYSSLSPRTLRGLVNRLENPLPCRRMGKRKILVRQSEFDAWLDAQSPKRKLSREQELEAHFVRLAANAIRSAENRPAGNVNVRATRKKSSP